MLSSLISANLAQITKSTNKQAKTPHYTAGMANVLMRFDGVNPVCKIGKACVSDDGKVICIPKKHKCRSGLSESSAQAVVSGKDLKEFMGNLALAGAAGIGLSAAIGMRNANVEKGENPYPERVLTEPIDNDILDKLKAPATIVGAGIAGGLLAGTNPTVIDLGKRIAQDILPPKPKSSKFPSSSPSSPPPTPPSTPPSPPPSPPSSPPPSPPPTPPSTPPSSPPSPKPFFLEQSPSRQAEQLLSEAEEIEEQVRKHEASPEEASPETVDKQLIEQLKEDIWKYEDTLKNLKDEISDVGSEIKDKDKNDISDERVGELLQLQNQASNLQAALEGRRKQALRLIGESPISNAKEQFQSGTLSIDRLPPDSIKVDPTRFQYKQMQDSETGSTRSLKEQTEYRELVAGALDVWVDPNDGNTYVVNGHNRLDLAKRTKVPDVAVNYLQVETAQEAKLLGAMLNIADDRGTNYDAAVLMRTIADNENLSINKQYASTLMQSQTGRNAVALASLGDSAWNWYREGTLPEGIAIKMGKYAKDGEINNDDQEFLLSIIKPKLSNMAQDEFDYLVKGLPTLKEMGRIEQAKEQLSLFEDGSGFSSQELKRNAERLAMINSTMLKPLQDASMLTKAVQRSASGDAARVNPLLESALNNLSGLEVEEATAQIKDIKNWVNYNLSDPSSPLIKEIIIPTAQSMTKMDDAEAKKYLEEVDIFGRMMMQYTKSKQPLAQSSTESAVDLVASPPLPDKPTTSAKPNARNTRQPNNRTSRDGDATIRSVAPAEVTTTTPTTQKSRPNATAKKQTEITPAQAQETVSPPADAPSPADAPKSSRTQKSLASTDKKTAPVDTPISKPVTPNPVATPKSSRTQKPPASTDKKTASSRSSAVASGGQMLSIEERQAQYRSLVEDMRKNTEIVTTDNGRIYRYSVDDGVVETKITRNNDNTYKVRGKQYGEKKSTVFESRLPTLQRAKDAAKRWLETIGADSIITARQSANRSEERSDSTVYTKPKLRERIKQALMAGTKGGSAGQWSARKSQLLVQRYEAAGGGYKGGKTDKQRSLSKWSKEDWNYADPKKAVDRPRDQRGRYLPKRVWDKLSPQQKAATNRTKNQASRSGKQYAKWNPFIKNYL